MVQINFGQREVSCKVVFYGPGMSGKTTNLEIIHKKAPKDAVGEMVSIATETDRTLYFDFLPLDLGQVAGMRTKFQLYTVPGQIYYNATRKLVLQGVDGVIFVADSNPDKMAENLESLQNLRDNLAEMNLKVEDLPLVLQYNKRDLPNALSVEAMNKQMNPMGAPTFEACARDGKGVFATLKEVSRLVIEKLNKENAPAANRRRTAGSMTPVGSPTIGAPAGAQPASAPARPAVQAVAPAAQPPQPAFTPPRPMPVQQPAPAAVAPRPAPAPPRPTVTAAPPAQAAPPADDLSPREKHLAKAKPQPLANAPRPGENISTEPNLKAFKQQQQGGGAVKTLLVIVLLLIALLIVVALLAVFVPAVTAAMPKGIQQLINGSPAPAASPATPGQGK